MLAPTLLIGLGGKGSDIVERVSRKVTEEQAKSISFVVFDTDVNELRDLKKKNSNIYTVQTSTRLTVGEYLNIDTHARDKWFPINRILNRKSLTEGAGQVRAISRLAFDTAIRANNMEPLHQAIEELYKLNGDEVQQALRVIVVSSLAGGTGSGLILPVSMYVKNHLKQRFQQSANIMRGFFILPEVFYEVIRGQAERNNLKCNAYATIRELDAFLMKGDGTLPTKYKNLVFEAPRVGSAQYDDYDVMPFDFCFLFDAQNVNGKKLNSFDQYLDHAANCIYAQSIGPMNKRSNSSEDNVIRELAKFGGRNRYSGAGSSILEYPMKDIRQYIALKWAKESVSDKWLKFDRDYKKQHQEAVNMRAQGIITKEIDKAQAYINNVDASKQKNDPFSTQIWNACYDRDDSGLLGDNGKWFNYIADLKEFVTVRVPKDQSELESMYSSVSNKVAELSNDDLSWDPYITAFSELNKFKGAINKSTEEKGRTLSYQLFKSDDATDDTQNYRIEKHLKNEDGFIHPNSIRYFLYQTLNELRVEKNNIDNKNKDTKSWIENFERTTFDDPKTEEIDGSVGNLSTRKVNPINVLLKRPTALQLQIKEGYVTLLNRLQEYRGDSLYAIVIDEAITYVSQLLNSFETFFNSFEDSVNGIEHSIKTIYDKYDHSSGHAVKYVCASKKCFDKFEEKMPFTGSAINLPGALSKTIFYKVREHSMLKGTSDDKRGSFFISLFDKDILGYFQNSVMDSYGRQIDMDIITALKTEAEFEKGFYDKNNDDYVREMITSTRNLSEPFIETPLGEQRSPITSCAYHPSLDNIEDPVRHDLVNEELRDFGGIPDEDIDRSMIIFYKAIYGLRAKDLSKFAPANVDANRPAGEYFKAYYELVSQITPDLEKNTVITPHIDRNWHVISQLPDLDEENQKFQEKEIFKALFYGLLYGKITFVNVSDDRNAYRVQIGDDKFDFKISNTTVCDKYYEVLDGLTINPSVVKSILKSVYEDMNEEKEDKVPFSQSSFKKNYDTLKFIEISDDLRSIFDFPVMLKVSTPTSIFVEDEGLDFVRNILETSYDYMSEIVPSTELTKAYGDFIRQQYAVFKTNLTTYEKNNYSAMGSFVDSMLYIVSNRMKGYGLDALAKMIENDAKDINAKRMKNVKA